jgi:hypothetical protein
MQRGGDRARGRGNRGASPSRGASAGDSGYRARGAPPRGGAGPGGGRGRGGGFVPREQGGSVSHPASFRHSTSAHVFPAFLRRVNLL